MSHIFSTLKKRASPRGSQSRNNSDSEQPLDGARALNLDLYDLTPSESYQTQEIMEEKVKRLEEMKRKKEAGRMMRDLSQIHMSTFGDKHGMLFNKGGNKAFVACNSNGPQYLVYWGAQAGRNVDPELKQGLMAFADTEWHIFKQTEEGQSWAAGARKRETQRSGATMDRNYYEEIRDSNTRRVNVGELDKEKRPERDGRGQNSKFSEEIWEINENKQKERIKRNKNLGKDPTDEKIVEKYWDRTLTDYTIPQLTAWMKTRMTSPLSVNGVEKVPKYTASMASKRKNVLIDLIEDWLTTKAVREGDKQWEYLLNKYKPAGAEIELGTQEGLKDIQDIITIGDEGGNWDSEIDGLQAIKNLNTTLSELKDALQIEETDNVEEELKAEMANVEEETNPETLKNIMETQLRKRIMEEKQGKKLKEEMARILAAKTKQDHGEDMVEAIDAIRTTGFRQDVLGLQQKLEDTEKELKDEKKNAIKEARRLETMNDKIEALKEAGRRQAEEYREKLLLASGEDHDTQTTGNEQDTENGTYHGGQPSEGEEESEDEGNNYNQTTGCATIPTTTGSLRPGILKIGGKEIVLDDYKKNLEMRDFTEEPVWWKSVIDTFALDPATGLRAIPPVVKSTAFQVENPKEGLIKAFKENINGSKDHFYNIFETAKMMIRHGICHHLLPQIYTDHLIPLNERNLLQSKPKTRSSITALLDYIRKKNHQLTGMENAQNRAIQYYTRELNKKDACLMMATHTLKHQHARDIMRCQVNYPQLGESEREVLKESLARGIMETEFKLHYKEAWNKALELGITHLPVEELAEKMNGIFHVQSKKKRVNAVAKKQLAKEQKSSVKKPVESKNTGNPKRKKVNNLMEKPPQRNIITEKPFQRNDRIGKPIQNNNKMEKPFQRRQGEPKPGRTSFPSRKPFQKNQKRTNPNLIPIPGNPGKFLWNSPDGKVKNLRLPCRYHEDKGADVYECKNSTPRHCYECSKPGFLAPPIRECKGNHQWKEDKPSSSSGRSNNSRRRI